MSDDYEDELESIVLADLDLYGPDRYDEYTTFAPYAESIIVNALKAHKVDLMITTMSEILSHCQKLYDHSDPITSLDVNVLRGFVIGKILSEGSLS